MMRKVTYIAALSVLTACAGTPPLETSGPQPVRIKQAKDNQFSNKNISIRSYRTAEDGTKVEVPGAVCSGQNVWFALPAISTPAVVQMPTFLQGERFANRGLPPELTVACKLDGKTIKTVLTASSTAQNMTTSSAGYYDAQTGNYSNPTTFHLTARLSSTLPWVYPSVRVEF